MQRAPIPTTIDPSLLDLKSHPFAPTYNIEELSTLDDVAIASGQACCIDVDGLLHGDQLYTNSDFHHNRHPDNISNPLDGADPSLPRHQSNFTTTTFASDFDWRSMGHYPDNSLSKEDAPWDLTKTFDFSALKAHESNCPSSYTHQSEPPSHCFSSPSNTSESFASSSNSHSFHQISPLQKRFLRESREASCCDNPGVLHDSASQCLNVSSCSCNIEPAYKADDSTVSSFPSLSSDDEPSLSQLTSATSAPRAIPGPSRTRGLANTGRSIVGRGSMEVLDDPTHQGLAYKPWQDMQPTGFAPTSAHKNDYQQSKVLAFEPKWNNSMYNNLSEATNFYLGNDSQDLDLEPFYSPYLTSHDHIDDANSAINNLTDVNFSEYSDHYQPELPSSCPLRDSHFPAYTGSIPTQRQQSSGTSTLQSNSLPLNSNHLTLRVKSTKTKRAGRSRSGSLRGIREEECGNLSSSPTGSMRGRRRGQLHPETALAAAAKRSKGDVCIRCRVMKQTCKGDLPCESCRKNSQARSWGQTCHQAEFKDIVDYRTCNAVFQTSATVVVVHPMGRSRRVTLSYPETFDLAILSSRLVSLQSQYNIRVRHFSGYSYTLDLARLSVMVSSVSKARDQTSYELDDFGKHRLSRHADWLDCICDHEASLDLVDQWIEWNNMPSRSNSYYYIPLNDAKSTRPIDVDNEVERRDISLAIDLCRIVLRFLEVTAFRTLQRKLNDLPKSKQSENYMESLDHNLSKVLFSLRWRIAWWSYFGLSPDVDSDRQDREVERVTALTRTLYFWYWVVRKRLSGQNPSFSSHIRNFYADAAEPVFEDLPVEDSITGFDTWMANGRLLIHQANIRP